MSSKSPMYNEVLNYLKNNPSCTISAKNIRWYLKIPSEERSKYVFIGNRLSEFVTIGILERLQGRLSRYRITEKGKTFLSK